MSQRGNRLSHVALCQVTSVGPFEVDQRPIGRSAEVGDATQSHEIGSDLQSALSRLVQAQGSLVFTLCDIILPARFRQVNVINTGRKA